MHTQSRTNFPSHDLVARDAAVSARSASAMLHAQVATTTEPEQTRIIVKWKADMARISVQAIAIACTEFHNATGLNLNARRNLGDRLDAIELDRPLHRAEFMQALNKLRAQPDVE